MQFSPSRVLAPTSCCGRNTPPNTLELPKMSKMRTSKALLYLKQLKVLLLNRYLIKSLKAKIIHFTVLFSDKKLQVAVVCVTIRNKTDAVGTIGFNGGGLHEEHPRTTQGPPVPSRPLQLERPESSRNDPGFVPIHLTIQKHLMQI